jgi:hypothetical protein
VSISTYVYLQGDPQPYCAALPMEAVVERCEASKSAGSTFVSLPMIVGGEDDTPSVTASLLRLSAIVAFSVAVPDEHHAELGMAIADAKRAHPEWFEVKR